MKAIALRDMAPLYSYYHNPNPDPNNICIYTGQVFQVVSTDKIENSVTLANKLSPYPYDGFSYIRDEVKDCVPWDDRRGNSILSKGKISI